MSQTVKSQLLPHHSPAIETESLVNPSLSDLNFVDDSYFASLFADDEVVAVAAAAETQPPPQQVEGDDDDDELRKVIFPVSDAKYAEGLQVQEALIGSFALSHHTLAIEFQPPMVESELIEIPGKRMKVLSEDEDEGESSLSFCEICAERKEPEQMMKIGGACSHASYCSDCISRHVTTKVRDSVVTVTCPAAGCETVLELETCRPVLPKGVIEQWEEVLCRDWIGDSQRYYCPFRDCSAMLLVEPQEELIRESECPYCHRLFCAQCGVPWHPDVTCEVFQSLGEDERGREDIMVMEMAKSNKWSRCPRCLFYVERTEGCPHITCRVQV
ncbi:E3 ubiquitin-protein ligase RSL1 [Linum perenne]